MRGGTSHIVSQVLRDCRRNALVLTSATALSLNSSTTGGISIAAPEGKPSQQKSPGCKGKENCNLPDSKAYSRPYGSHLNAILSTINASEEQKTSITAIVETFRPRIDPLRQSYNQKRQEFLAGLTSGLSSDQLMVKQTDLSQLSSDISSQYCQMSLEIRRQLKPEQIVLYEEYRLKQGWSRKKPPGPAGN